MRGTPCGRGPRAAAAEKLTPYPGSQWGRGPGPLDQTATVPRWRICVPQASQRPSSMCLTGATPSSRLPSSMCLTTAQNNCPHPITTNFFFHVLTITNSDRTAPKDLCTPIIRKPGFDVSDCNKQRPHCAKRPAHSHHHTDSIACA